jgi:hypothetical protein
MKKSLLVLLAGALLLAVLLLLRLAPKPSMAPAAPSPPGNAPAPLSPEAKLRAAKPPEATLPSRPRLTPKELVRVAGDIVQAIFLRKTETLPRDIPNAYEWATNMPVGYFQLLVRAYPDEAFEIYSARYLDPNQTIVAYWALGELARLKHEPTFRLFNALLESKDPIKARQALKALVNYDTPELGARVLAVAPLDPQDFEQVELLSTSLRVAAEQPSTDRAILDRLIEKFDALANEEGLPNHYGTLETRLHAEILRAPDVTAALAGLVTRDTDDPSKDLERAEWAADVAVRQGRRDLVTALQNRIRKTLDHLKEDERLGELDILGRQAMGQYDAPSLGAFGGLAEVRGIAHLRRAILDLGGTLTDEERRWMDGLRMLRTPKEYLREAGLIE